MLAHSRDRPQASQYKPLSSSIASSSKSPQTSSSPKVLILCHRIKQFPLSHGLQRQLKVSHFHLYMNVAPACMVLYQGCETEYFPTKTTEEKNRFHCPRETDLSTPFSTSLSRSMRLRQSTPACLSRCEQLQHRSQH